MDIGAYLGLRAYRIGLGVTGQLADWWHGLFKSDKVRKVKEVAGQVLIMDKGGVGQEIPAADSPERLQYDVILLTAPMQFEAEKADLTNGGRRVLLLGGWGAGMTGRQWIRIRRVPRFSISRRSRAWT